jgi:hypothetical protein
MQGTHTRGKGNGTVGVAKGYSYRDSLRGVRLRTHLAREGVLGLGERGFSRFEAFEYQQESDTGQRIEDSRVW